MSPHRRAWRWLAARPFVASLVLVALVTGAGAVVLVRHDACVARWADATADRAQALGGARRAVDDANDALWREFAALLAEPPPDARERFAHVLDTYVRASDDYRRTTADHPAPAPPRLGCGR